LHERDRSATWALWGNSSGRAPFGAVSSRGRAARSGGDRTRWLGRDLARAPDVGELAFDTPRCLNERIARLANEEDECTGRFWEGRFKSQALLDDQAVIACMAYVDLNPVRAGIAETPEDSDHTSIQRRIRALQAAAEPETPAAQETPEPTSPLQPLELLPFVGGERQDGPKGLPFDLPDYLELVNWTGQAVRDDKRGAISQDLPPILERLGIDEQAWLRLATNFETSFNTWVGTPEHVHSACRRLGHRRARGISACRLLFPS